MTEVALRDFDRDMVSVSDVRVAPHEAGGFHREGLPSLGQFGRCNRPLLASFGNDGVEMTDGTIAGEIKPRCLPCVVPPTRPP